ncbi:hypothetical protein [Aminobacter aminovorans]|uniref:hypothetical protein n=2 Tax=Aminobacter TaxID=31988 RepID=UPI002854F328|nr:hypothetical protein [Aminobacter aminovorans]MDR7219975.1 hypothetical protein [Aminobacter aminovorans]
MRRLALTAAAMTIAVGAAAETIDLDGNYGNAAGCNYAVTDNATSDDLLLLTPRGVSTYVTECEFVTQSISADGSRVLSATCTHEGETETTVRTIRIEKAPDQVDAYLIFDEDGTMWGKVGQCS